MLGSFTIFSKFSLRNNLNQRFQPIYADSQYPKVQVTHKSQSRCQLYDMGEMKKEEEDQWRNKMLAQNEQCAQSSSSLHRDKK